MTFDIRTAKWVIWGASGRNGYNTFEHIHKSFYRALASRATSVLA